MTQGLKPELTGAHFSLAAMQGAQQQALVALEEIAARLKPGMTEPEAATLALQVLQQAGAEQHWHPPIVRFGRNTAKIYSEASEPGVCLQPEDIFFIDIGPVFDGHEADVGATFCLGDQPAQRKVRQATSAVFQQVAAHWKATGCSGSALYQYAKQCAEAFGMQLNHQIKGHRVGDFPHKLYASGQLGGYEGTLRAGIWVLEIQLLDPASGFGGFMEQVLF